MPKTSIIETRELHLNSTINASSLFPFLELYQGEEIWKGINMNKGDNNIYGRVILQDNEFEISGRLDTFTFAIISGVGIFLIGGYPSEGIFYMDPNFNPKAQIVITENNMNCAARFFRYDGEKFHISQPICLPYFLIDFSETSYEEIVELLSRMDSHSNLLEWYIYPDCNSYIFRRLSGSC